MNKNYTFDIEITYELEIIHSQLEDALDEINSCKSSIIEMKYSLNGVPGTYENARKRLELEIRYNQKKLFVHCKNYQSLVEKLNKLVLTAN
jgi:hypothetical protein